MHSCTANQFQAGKVAPQVVSLRLSLCETGGDWGRAQMSAA